MIIGVDAGALSVDDERLKVGVFRTSINLLKELTKLDTKNLYRLYSFRQIEKEIMREFGRNVTNVILSPARGYFSLRLPLELKFHSVDVFLGISQALPSLTSHNIYCDGIYQSLTILLPLLRRRNSHRKMAQIAFIYDVAFMDFPEFYPQSAKSMEKQTRQAVGRADQIITISNYSKQSLLKYFNFDSSKIKVVYEGVDHELFSPREANEVDKFLKTHNLPEKYFLYVGAIKPGKNIKKIIESVKLFNKQSKYKIPLVMAGSNYWQEVTNSDDVVNLEFISDDELPYLYSGAVSLISPSLVEGFGLTHLEAMACGCPVIGSTAGSLPEVIGDAGILVNPEKIEEIVEALQKISTNLNLRKELINKGLKRAQQFTWKKFAKGVYKVIKNYEN